jgi:hypothetical protein
MLETGAQPVERQLAVLVLIRDLMFSSRVTSTAAQLGVAVKMLRDPARLAGEAGERLIVDLNLPGAIEAAQTWKSSAGTGELRSAVGFVSHVDAETIHKARAAGIDRVMARSQFVQVLPDLLRSPTG